MCLSRQLPLANKKAPSLNSHVTYQGSKKPEFDCFAIAMFLRLMCVLSVLAFGGRANSEFDNAVPNDFVGEKAMGMGMSSEEGMAGRGMMMSSSMDSTGSTVDSMGSNSMGSDSMEFGMSPLSATLLGALDGFAAPESVVYDASRNAYFVSSVTTGAVSKVTKGEPEILQVGFCDPQGGLLGAVGLAVLGDIVYVGGFSTVHKCDADTGDYLGSLDFGAVGYTADFINDVAADPLTGIVYVTDLATDITFQGTGNSALYAIDTRNGDAISRIRSEGAGFVGPNGVHVGKDAIYVGGQNWIEKLEFDGSVLERMEYQTISGIDGLEVIGSKLVISVFGAGLFTVDADDLDNLQELLLIACADLGFDDDDDLILCPELTFDGVAFAGSKVFQIGIH